MGREGLEGERGVFLPFICFRPSGNGRSEVTFCHNSGVTWGDGKQDTVQSKQASLPGSCRLLAGPSTTGHASRTCAVDTRSSGRVRNSLAVSLSPRQTGRTSTIPVAPQGVTAFSGGRDRRPLGGGGPWEPAVGVSSGGGQSQTDRSGHLKGWVGDRRVTVPLAKPWVWEEEGGRVGGSLVVSGLQKGAHINTSGRRTETPD